MKKVVITIPAYDEERTIGHVIREIRQVMTQTKYKFLIHVQDDGSHDNTVSVAKKNKAIVSKNFGHLGLADTFKNEMKNCLKLGADVIIHIDADGQYYAKDIPRLLAKLDEGYDLVLGSRFRGRRISMSALKRLGNIAFSLVFRHLTKLKLTDTTTGFRAFTANIAENITYINKFTYTQEQILKAAKHNFLITEIPIATRRTRDSRLFCNPLRYAIKAWINILRIYRDFDPIKFFGVVGFMFLIPGFLIGIWFLYLHYFSTGIVGHLGMLFLMLLLMFTGVQVILFGFMADKWR